MAHYSAIKAAVNAYIKQNGRKEITGRILNAVLNATIDSLGRYFQFAGGALPTDDPGTPDQNVCYLAGEPGVYTNFGGITIENEEVALLFWDGEWTKQRILIGIREVNASVDNLVGTPSVDVSYSGGQLVLTFHNLKGNPGIPGSPGTPAGFGTIGADVDENIGTPGVSVETSGTDTAKNLMFHFTNLKGETGVTSVVATIDNTSGTPSCQVSLLGQQLTLAFSGLKGLKGDTGVSADYPITIYNGLDSDATDQALAAAQGKVLKGEIDQLEAEVDEIGDVVFQGTQTTDITSTLTISDKSYSRANGTANQTGQHSTPISVSPGEKYLVSGKTGYYTCLIAEFDASDVFIQGVGINTGGQLDMVDYEYTVPEGVAKVGFSTRDAANNPITVKKVVNKTIADVLDEWDITKANKTDVTEILVNKNSDVFSVINGTDTVVGGVHTLVYDGNNGFVRLTQSVDKELLPQEKDKVIYIGALMYIDKRMNPSADYGLDIKINCVDGFITLSGELKPLVGKWYLVSAAYNFGASATNQNFSVLFSANFSSTGQSGSTAKMKGFFISDTLQGFSVEDTKLLYDTLLTKIGWDLSAPIPAYSKTATFKRLINEEKVKATIPQDITVTVGASGDFPNINAAMNYLSQFYPAYLPGGVHAYIKILSGTTITDQVFVDGADWSWMTIIYEDYNPESLNYDTEAADIANGTIVFDSTPGYNAVPVNASAFSGVTHDSRGDECLFRAENGGKLPTIGCVFKLVTDSEHGCCGVLCNRGSECVVKTLCGFIGFKDGVISNNESSITIREGITMNCTRWGCHARHNGEVSARSVIATGCGSIGTTEAGAAVADRVANMDVREAYLGNSRVAIRASNASMICARAAHIIGGGVSGVYLVQAEYSGIINASQIEFSGVTGDGLSVKNGGQMDAFSLIGSATFNVNKNEVSANGIIYG